MAIGAPHLRKHLSADALFHVVRRGCAALPDHRLDDAEMAFTDARMSAFARFSLQAPSLLAFDQERTEGTLHTIDGIERIPCDTPRREMLAPIPPKVLRPVCTSVLRQRQRGKALEAMTFLDGHS
jgi:hypothetical protein